MAVEKARGCGYRKVGGLYLVTEGMGEPCERLPIPIMPCTCCGSRIKQSRGWQWVDIAWILSGARSCDGKPDHCPHCPVCTPRLFADAKPMGKAGLLWIGGKFYKDPNAWMHEAQRMGVSRRIHTIPKGFELGKTWTFVAHPEAIPAKNKGKEGQPAIFHVFKTQKLELIVTEKMKSEKWVKDFVKKGVTLVEVPEDDPDHAPVAKERKSKRQRSLDKLARKARKEAEENQPSLVD
jgi:hypothetical protein